MITTARRHVLKLNGERWKAFMQAALSLMQPAVDDPECWLQAVSIRRPVPPVANRVGIPANGPAALG